MSWLKKKNVVAPVDFSPLSEKTIDVALQLVEKPSEVHVLYVLPTIEPAEPGVIWNTIDNPTRERHALQSLHERFPATKYGDLQFHVAFGDAGHEIANYAQEINAELVVLPSHGRTGITRLLIGSVAERAVRLCHCPVLVLRW